MRPYPMRSTALSGRKPLLSETTSDDTKKTATKSPTEKKLPPMLFTVGTEDTTTTPKSIEAYIKKLKDAGHTNIKYWQHQDRPHAFLDSGSNEFLKINFEDDAVPALKVMISYLDSIFY